MCTLYGICFLSFFKLWVFAFSPGVKECLMDACGSKCEDDLTIGEIAQRTGVLRFQHC